jgi:anti-sigma regulatory factor (Ser/Thr protein kinase)
MDTYADPVVGFKPRGRRRFDEASVEFLLPATAAAAGRAREAVRGILIGWGLDSESDTATLLVSELVTNAVRHAGTTLRVTLTHHQYSLHIAVSDGAVSQWPHLVEANPDDEGGRGLWLVDRLSESWGTSQADTGKSVWFELSLDQRLTG